MYFGDSKIVLIRFVFRSLGLAAAVFLGFCLIELTWNEYALDMDFAYVVGNLIVLSFVLAIIYFLGQRTRVSVAFFLLICLMLGVANFYVIEFRWDPVMPVDLLAVGTALEVAGGYSFNAAPQVVASFIVFAIAVLALLFTPSSFLLELNRSRVIANIFISAVLVGFGWWYLAEGDFEEDFGCEVVSWETLTSYQSQGAALCFASSAQDLFPVQPEGYSAKRAAEVLGEAGGASAAELAAAEKGERPTVVVVMNESFADLSRFESVSDAARPNGFYDIAQDSLASGFAYASNFGGGTCNSEFEVLTGASVGNMGELVFPYSMYDLAGNENLVTYFEALGYASAAIHPEDATNWRRNIVYPKLGFDDFYSIDAFDEDSERLRGYVTDRETYNLVLELIESEDEPLFVFDVTMQNHGGYETGRIEASKSASVPVNGVEYDSLNEYVSSLQESDADLVWFVEQLEALDEPVVLLFFGDHQPKLTNVPDSELYGFDTEAIALEQMMVRQEVPYLIWANYSIEVDADVLPSSQIASQVTSLNFLGMRLISTIGLPLTSYHSTCLRVNDSLPAITRLGFMAIDGNWYSFDDVGGGGVPHETVRALSDYAVIQYANLFDQGAAQGALIR